MYKTPIPPRGLLKGNEPTEGETIEEKVVRLVQNKEPIKDGVPIIFTERSKGVNPAFNIRTDRWEIATETMDKLLKVKNAKSEEVGMKPEVKGEVTGGESTAGGVS